MKLLGIRQQEYFRLFFLVAFVLFCSACTVIAGEQLYFTGMVAPLGSLSSPGQATKAVYLRWDQLEGAIPQDLAGFRLLRDDVQIYPALPAVSIPAVGVMSVAEIEALYAGVEQARRRLETLHWLAEWGKTLQPVVTVNEGNFALHLRERLLSDPYWSYFASRTDFNVARARYRGYLDTAAPAGSHTYRLMAVSADNSEVKVGEVVVDTASAAILAPARGVKQVRLGRCDAPETAKDHGAVALNWAVPGTNAGDRYVGSLLQTGYDIYRSESNVTEVDEALDLRSLAATVSHTTDGSLSLPGLTKINDQPVIVSSQNSDAVETGKKGWNPPFFQFLETAEELAAQGVHPGDKRAYYIVPRDLTGNYGDTARILVTVPDVVAPPPPWAVRTVKDPIDDTFFLEWDQVDVPGFHLRHRNSRVYCNLNTARFDRELRWVPEGKTCDSYPQRTVDLDVAEYRVYRFEKNADAAVFTDTDGDGWADTVEREILSTVEQLTSPGTACDAQLGPSSPPAGAVNHLVASVNAADAVIRSSGRRILRFNDPVIAQNKGRIYWYRLASVDQEGNVSSMSSPVRVFFPDRNRPQRCDGSAGILTELECTYVVNEDIGSEEYATDFTGEATSVVTTCSDQNGVVYQKASPVTELIDVRGVAFDDDLCTDLEANCAGMEVTVSFISEQGETLGQRSVGTMDGVCTDLSSTRINKDCATLRMRTVESGDIIKGDLQIDCHPAADQCLSIYRDFGGTTFHYKTICPPIPQKITLQVSELAGLGENQICLSLALQNQNNEVSAKSRLPCFRVADAAGTIGLPQPVELTFSTTGDPLARLSWVPPEQPVAGTIIEWYLLGGDKTESFSDFIPHSARSAGNGTIETVVEISSEPAGNDWEEEWCFRVRSVGHAEQLSDWSTKKCAIRKPAAIPLPQYIPWPKIQVPPQMGMLRSRYLPVDGMPVVQLTEPVTGVAQCDGERPLTCEENTGLHCLRRGTDTPTSLHCSDICALLKGELGGMLNFVAYRQSTDDVADPAGYGEYVQVSPLIENLFCVSDYRPGYFDGVLQDPFIKLVNFNFNDPDWDGYRLVFADQYPHVKDRWYRYQLVYFDAKGEIAGYRQTDWFQAQ